MIRSLNSLVRNRTDELMDQPDLPESDHQMALRGLARLNRFTGIAKSMFATIRTLASKNPDRPLRIMDIASGSGDIPIAWAKQAAREGIPLEITTVDISPVAVQTQADQAEAALAEIAQGDTTPGQTAAVRISPLQLDCLNSKLPGGHDIVTNSLFMHHLDEPDVIKLVGAMHRAAEQQVLICDLERSRLNLALVWIGAHALSRSSVVHTDSSLSVHGAYTMDEFRELGAQAIGQEIPVQRVVPCRFISTWRTAS